MRHLYIKNVFLVLKTVSQFWLSSFGGLIRYDNIFHCDVSPPIATDKTSHNISRLLSESRDIEKILYQAGPGTKTGRNILVYQKPMEFFKASYRVKVLVKPDIDIDMT
jgi:hypothetical protein